MSRSARRIRWLLALLPILLPASAPLWSQGDPTAADPGLRMAFEIVSAAPSGPPGSFVVDVTLTAGERAPPYDIYAWSPGAGALALLDSNGDARIDIGDPVHVLYHLFGEGGPPALGRDCTRIPGCSSRCAALPAD